MNVSVDEEPLRKLLSTFTYKPGWTFNIEDGNLFIRTIAIDTDNFDRTTTVSFRAELPRFARPDFPWDRWLLDWIIEMEKHEAQEFFKIDGVKVFDPHA